MLTHTARRSRCISVRKRLIRNKERTSIYELAASQLRSMLRRLNADSFGRGSFPAVHANRIKELLRESVEVQSKADAEYFDLLNELARITGDSISEVISNTASRGLDLPLNDGGRKA